MGKGTSADDDDSSQRYAYMRDFVFCSFDNMYFVSIIFFFQEVPTNERRSIFM